MSLIVLRQTSRALGAAVRRKPGLLRAAYPHARSFATAADQQAAGGDRTLTSSSSPQPKSTPTHFNLTATPHPVPDAMGHHKSKAASKTHAAEGDEDRVEKGRGEEVDTDTDTDTDTRTRARARGVENVTVKEHAMGPSVWTRDEVLAVKVTHRPVDDLTSALAYGAVQSLRTVFDTISGYKLKQPTADMYLNRLVFLETSAGVPGMVAAMLRHFRSLRSMQRDYGWIHTLLEEAENERMHLLTFSRIKQPGLLFRVAVTLLQGAMANSLFLAYIVRPRFVHRFVGYLEEEAVKTYTKIIEDVASGKVPELGKLPVPGIAKDYWRLGDDATFQDLLLMVRADEANHRCVNHTLASLEPTSLNPFVTVGKTLEPPLEKEKEKQQERNI